MQRFEPQSPLGKLVVENRERLLEAAARRHAHDVRVFGSLARGDDTRGSDVDLLVTLDAKARPLDIVSLACDAEDILGVRVDVGTIESLRPDVQRDALAEAVLL